jgi:alpha-tubulin suppressor-like RCC1 family protein
MRDARTARLILSTVALVASLLTVTSAPAPRAVAVLAPDASATLAGGIFHQCAVRSDQTVACWGGNEVGQLGDTTLNDSSVPVAVDGLTDVVALDAATATTCALRSNGTVGCWGSNSSGQIGDGAAVPFRSAPSSGNGLIDVVDIAVGDGHACAVIADGTVSCWGRNNAGQLGNGSTVDSNTPVTVTGLTDAVAVSAGGSTTCARSNDGALTCWGSNANGTFGNGTTTGSTTPLAITPTGTSTGTSLGAITDVSVGLGATCVITIDGQGWCTGAGPLGDGTDESSSSFVPITLRSVLDIDVSSRACAIAPDSTTWCWGAGETLIPFAALESESLVPTLVQGSSGTVALDTNDAHTCIGVAGGSVRCWGTDIDGQLQLPVGARTADPVPVDGIQASAVSTGYRTCLVTLTNSVSCAGVDLTFESVASPVPSPSFQSVPELDGTSSLSARFFHSCAVRVGGTVTCWGVNLAGEIGVPPSSELETVSFTDVAGLGGVVEVAAGGSFSCATTGAGARCWGIDDNGQLGNDAALVDSASPVAVQVPGSTTGVDLIGAGAGHACARITSGIGSFVGCWGRNSDGQLGDGTTNDRPTPASAGVIFPKALAVGNQHSCAIDSVDGLYCWGYNDDGQLGIGSTVDQTTKQQVTGLPALPIDVAAGASHTCALLADATVACWGDNSSRQLGQAGGDMSTSPLVVPGLSGVAQIEASGATTCAILIDTSVRCWGDNLVGQLGSNPQRLAPATMALGGTLLAPATAATEAIVVPVEPARLLETRDGLDTVDGAFEGGGAIRRNTQIEVDVVGRGGVPADADVVVVNITAVRPETNGFITAHGCLQPRPVVAQLNFTSRPDVGSITLGNESIVELSESGSLCIYTSATTDITVDVTAYGTTAGGYRPTTPARILETRDAASTVDGEAQLGAPITGGTEVTLPVAGRAGVPSTASAAVLYIAAVQPTGVGFLTAHPCLGTPPQASSLNYGTLPGGQRINRGNEIIAPLDDDGNVCLFVSTTTDLTVDVMGSIDASTTYEVKTPARILESRVGLETVDGEFELGRPIDGGTEVAVRVTGRAGVGNDARAAVLNITAVRPSGVGFVTAYPCSPQRPTASSLNFTSSPSTGAINGGNEVLAPLSSSGSVCLFVSTTTHLTVDVVGSA